MSRVGRAGEQVREDPRLGSRLWQEEPGTPAGVRVPGQVAGGAPPLPCSTCPSEGR